jgi:hypothetical protein
VVWFVKFVLAPRRRVNAHFGLLWQIELVKLRVGVHHTNNDS